MFLNRASESSLLTIESPEPCSSAPSRVTAPGETQRPLHTLLLVPALLEHWFHPTHTVMLSPTHTALHHRLQVPQQVAQVAHALLVKGAGPHGTGQHLLHVELHHLRHRLAAEGPLGREEVTALGLATSTHVRGCYLNITIVVWGEPHISPTTATRVLLGWRTVFL